ncbi:MAG TPA: hypothetical protein VI685_09915 [Candidatus Angelobacter sp.]
MKAGLIIAFTAAVLLIARSYSESPVTPDDNAIREQGRRLFAGKCGTCHDEDGKKKLSDGSTLLTRLSSSKDPQALLGTRLKSMTADDRHAVVFYVEGLLSQFRSANK